jgi:hypothetical protein
MSKNTPPDRRYVLWLTLILVLALGAYLHSRGHGFYFKTLEARLEHPEYTSLRPSGPVGHGYGIAGTALIFTNLLYLVRRRLARLSIGSLRRWLDVHVLAGLAGAVLVAYHSAFQVRTAIATTTALSLAVLVGTGMVGLYIYRLLPRTGMLPFRKRLDEVEKLLPGFAKIASEAVEAVPTTTLAHDASLLRTLLTVPRWMREARARRRSVTAAAKRDPVVGKIARDERVLVRNLVEELSDLAASEVDASAGAAIMRSWRSLHGLMAILMVLAVTVHVAVAWVYGYRWIFSE